MKRVVVIHFLLDFAHKSRVERRKKELGCGEIVRFVVLVVEEKLLGTKSFGSRDGVAGVTFDDIRHRHGVLRIWEVGNGVHPTIGEMVPNSILKVDETAGLRKEGRHASTTEVVALLRGSGMDRTELVW